MLARIRGSEKTKSGVPWRYESVVASTPLMKRWLFSRASRNPGMVHAGAAVMTCDIKKKPSLRLIGERARLDCGSNHVKPKTRFTAYRSPFRHIGVRFYRRRARSP